MKGFLVLCFLALGGLLCQAQTLPKNWYKKADTAYIKKQYVIGIAKNCSDSLTSLRATTLDSAKARVTRLLKLETVSYEVIGEELFFDSNSNQYKYYVAIAVKKP